MSYSNVPLIDQQVLSHLSELLGFAEYRDLLGQTVIRLSDAASRLGEPLEQKDLRKLVHWIKGSLGTLGLARLASIAAQIEARCHQGTASDEDVPLLRDIIVDSHGALENLLNPPAS